MEDSVRHRDSEAAKPASNNNTERKVVRVLKDRVTTPIEVWDKYICSCCGELLDEAVQCACGHRLCRSCAVDIFNKYENPTCFVKEDGEEHLMIPDDVEDKSQKFFPDKFAQRDIQKLMVTCQYPGCPATIMIKNLQKHILECTYASKHELCEYCNKFIPADEVDCHECPDMQKSCPLSDLARMNGFDELLNEMKRHNLKSKLNEALSKCKGKKLPIKKFHSHLNDSHEDHLKAITAVLNALITLSAELYKMQRSELPPPSIECERDGLGKPQLKKTDMFGGKVVTDGLSDFSKEIERQIVMLKTNVDEMRKDSNQSHKESVMLQNDLSHAREQIQDLKAKVDFFEQKLATREQQLEEKDFRISLLESATYDGKMIWRISSFESRTKDARDARYTSIFSLPFYTHKYGYKMCLRLYPLGDGMGKNTHISLFFVVMKGEYDNLLPWPFANGVSLTLINQSGGPDITDTFKPDSKSSSFQRPKTEMNVASGCPRFIPLDDLHRNGFIKDDTIFIRVKVDPITTRY